MLLDLWGRGYSDNVDLPHDSRLYTTEILLAITSSPLAWTPQGFSLIGYSLGGGIVVDFATCFQTIVKSIVLLAPAGMIRPYHFGWQSRLMYSGLLPDSFLEWAVERRLKAGPVHSTVHKTANPENAVSEEIKGTRNVGFESAPLSKNRPGVTVASAVQWQLNYHEGFVRSFVNSIKHSSIEGQQTTWKKLGLRNDKVMIIAGTTDPVITPHELHEDALDVMGEDKIEWRVIEGGHVSIRVTPISIRRFHQSANMTYFSTHFSKHKANLLQEFPITRSDEVVKEVSGMWGI